MAAAVVSVRSYFWFKTVLKRGKPIAALQITRFCSLNSCRTCVSNNRTSLFSTIDTKFWSSSVAESPLKPVSAPPTKPVDDPSAKPEPNAADSEEERKKREKSWRTMKYGLWAFGGAFTMLGTYMLYELGSPKRNEFGSVIEDEFSHLPVPQQFFKRMLRELDYFNRMIREPSRDKLLPDPLTYPYLQPRYTLVLEMTDVLVHPDWTYKTGWRFKKRPGVDNFFEQIAPPMYEIVVFTAEQGMTVFPILDKLDPQGYIMYRLVRDATHFVDGHHVKDLDNLNRDLTKVIVIDWNADSVKLHPRNRLVLPRWRGNDDDHTLADLAAFLRTIAEAKVEDVREVLEYYHQFDNPLEAFRENQRKLQEQMQEKEKQQAEMSQGSLTRKWKPSFL